MILSNYRKDRLGGIILLTVFAALMVGLLGLWSKARHDVNTPIELHMKTVEPKAVESGEVDTSATYGIAVSTDISKHWQNDPDTPLQTYGAQYDIVISDTSDYDLVNWSMVLVMPERNVTLDSYWNGEWVYDKQSDMVMFTPDSRIETIAAGDSGTFGAIIISKELMDITDVVFTGSRYKPITKYWMFWLILVLLVAWSTSVVAYILYLNREKNHRRITERLNTVIDQTMRTFANFIDTKDKGDTKGHSSRVAYYSQKIAEKLGMSEDEIRDIGYIGLMHDCGKLAIPGGILNKPGKLSVEEFDIMRSHTTNGGRILSDFTEIKGIKDGALYHHERYDGKGYMEGLKGEEIPLVARIIGVADALDAMSHDRCYRKHLDRETILKELEDNRGTQFDPKIAQIVIDMIESGEIFV